MRVESSSSVRLEGELPTPDTSGMQPRVAQRIDEARQAVLRKPFSADAWGGFGLICDAHLLADHAATCYRRAMALAPDDFRWVYLLAILRNGQDAGVNEVLALFQAAVRLKPDFAPTRFRIGVILAEEGPYNDAYQAYLEAIELDPSLAIARRRLGQLMLTLGDTRVAISQLEHVLQLAPKDGPTYAALAQAYMRSGDRRRA